MAKARIVTMKASQLILDFTIYPRNQVAEYHVGDLAETLRAGQALPPIIAEEGTFRIVDGFHRTRAHQKVYGLETEVAVELRTYKSPADLFLDCVRLNAHHGRRLSAYDHAHCITLAEGFAVTPELLASALTITVDSLTKIRQTKTAISTTGEALPIRRSVVHLAGTRLSETQQEGAQAMGGMPLLYYTNQLITALDHDLVPPNHPVLVERLHQLFLRLQSLQVGKAA